MKAGKRLLVVSVAIALVYVALHALGLRDAVSVLSGTPVDAPALPYEVGAVLGLIYALVYFAATIVAPILAIAAALLAIDTGLRRASRS